jgi:hypothetical protein
VVWWFSGEYEVNEQSQPTLLDLGRPYPNATFTAVVYGDHRQKFGTPEVTLRGKRICVTGQIIDYQGKPEIVFTNPSQLTERGEVAVSRRWCSGHRTRLEARSSNRFSSSRLLQEIGICVPGLSCDDHPSAINSSAIIAPTASLSFSSLKTDGDGTHDLGNVLDCQLYRGNRLGVRAPCLCSAPVIRHLGDGGPRQSQAL